MTDQAVIWRPITITDNLQKKNDIDIWQKEYSDKKEYTYVNDLGDFKSELKHFT